MVYAHMVFSQPWKIDVRKKPAIDPLLRDREGFRLSGGVVKPYEGEMS